MKRFIFFISFLLLFSCGSFIWAQEKRFVSDEEDKPITFGVEVEFDVEKYPVILRFYKLQRLYPEKKSDFYSPTDKQWIRLSEYEKMDLFRKHHFKDSLIKGKLYSRWNGDDVITYKKLEHFNANTPEEEELWKLLGSKLTVEARGNVEVNGLVFDDLDEMKNFLWLLKKVMGEGDAQVHVAFPHMDLPWLFGYTLYEHDRAFLRRLAQEFEEYRVHPKFVPAVQAVSDWDGLLSNTRKQEIKFLQQKIKEREFPAGETARVYRTGIPSVNKVAYPEHLIGFEFRQEDNPSENPRSYLGSYGRLLMGMDRLSYVLRKKGNLYKFRKFDEIEVPYDHNTYEVEKTHGLNELNSLEYNQNFVLKRWHELLFSRAPTVGERMKKLKEQLVVDSPVWKFWEEKLRNPFSDRSTLHAFLHPLRDWPSYPLVRNLPKEAKMQQIKKIDLATAKYLETLVTATTQAPQASFLRKARIALAQWGKDSGLMELFPAFELQKNLMGKKRFTVRPEAPLLSGFDILHLEKSTHYLPRHHEMVEAAKNNNIIGIQEWLAQGVDINSIDRRQMTAILNAAYWGKLDALHFLLQAGADPNIRNIFGGTALIQAAYQNQLGAVKMLLEDSSVRQQIDVSNKFHKNALAFAIQNSNLAMVKLLVQRGAQLDPLGELGKSALAFVVQQGHLSAASKEKMSKYFQDLPQLNAEFLQAVKNRQLKDLLAALEKGAQVNVLDETDERCGSALDLLVRDGAYPQQLEMLQALLVYGANINAINSNGDTPLLSTIKSKNFAALPLLLKHPNIKLDHKNKKGAFALIYALHLKNLNLVKMLVSHGARLDSIFRKKLGRRQLPYNVLQMAEKISPERLFPYLQRVQELFTRPFIVLEGEDEDIIIPQIKSLVLSGIPLNTLNDQGENILMVAARKGYRRVVEFLLRHDVNVFQREYLHGHTALSLALYHKHWDVAKRLILDRRVNVHNLNEFNESAQLLVQDENQQDLLQLLLIVNRSHHWLQQQYPMNPPSLGEESECAQLAPDTATAANPAPISSPSAFPTSVIGLRPGVR